MHDYTTVSLGLLMGYAGLEGDTNAEERRSEQRGFGLESIRLMYLVLVSSR